MSNEVQTMALTVFRFGMSNTSLEDFLARTDDSQVIANARSQLALPEAKRRQHITGLIHRAKPGENLGWSWQHNDSAWSFSQISIEVCDARPSYIEEHLDEWLKSPNRFCPWACYVKSEEGVGQSSGGSLPNTR
jgi:hypothetical protein